MCGAFSCMITGFSGLEAYSEIRANFFTNWSNQFVNLLKLRIMSSQSGFCCLPLDLTCCLKEPFDVREAPLPHRCQSYSGYDRVRILSAGHAVAWIARTGREIWSEPRRGARGRNLFGGHWATRHQGRVRRLCTRCRRIERTYTAACYTFRANSDPPDL